MDKIKSCRSIDLLHNLSFVPVPVPVCVPVFFLYNLKF